MNALRTLQALLLTLLCALAQAPQQSEVKGTSFEDIKARAEKGDVDAQNAIGYFYSHGLFVTKDTAEALKWYRKAAEQGGAQDQYHLGLHYANGLLGAKDTVEAVKWYRKAAAQGYAQAQVNLGVCYQLGEGVTEDKAEAVKWYWKAAKQGEAGGQSWLGGCFARGEGVTKDPAEAVKWYRKAALQGDAQGQYGLSISYYNGTGVPSDYVEAHKWCNLASAQGLEDCKKNLPIIERLMTREQIAEAQRLAREFRPRKSPTEGASYSRGGIAESNPKGSGTGFIIAEDGFLVTNEHVVKDAAQVRVLTGTGSVVGKVMKVDAANDLALLKVAGKFTPLPIASSRTVKLGNTVATVGFPNIGLQGFAPKLTKGEISALTGAQDDPRYFQISVPVQPGNSGGALVDERGNVVGVVSAKLSARAALQTSGALPENVNYAVKSSFLLSFLESVPAVAAQLKEPNTKDRKFEDVVKSAEQAAVLVLVY